MKHFILLLIIIFSLISLFWNIDTIPPLLDASLLSSRLISAAVSTGSILLIFFYAKNSLKSRNIALLSTWTFSLLPWTIEQGRIISQPNVALFFFITLLILSQRSNLIQKLFLYGSIPIGFYILYPQFWVFKIDNLNFSIKSIINNVFILTSPDFIFFKNITFWWGGVREIGIIHLSFLPFLVVGIYEVIINHKWNIFFWIGFILFISSLSPFFPESREFFLAIPFLSIIIAFGINGFFKQKSLISKVIFYLVFVMIVYDLAQFWHYYTVHYPQQILGNLSQIHEPF